MKSRRFFLAAALIGLLAFSCLLGGCSSEPEPGYIRVVNNYSVTQYIWMDGSLKGTVGVGSSRTWEVDPGSYNMRATDSGDYYDNPAVTTITVDEDETITWTIY